MKPALARSALALLFSLVATLAASERGRAQVHGTETAPLVELRPRFLFDESPRRNRPGYVTILVRLENTGRHDLSGELTVRSTARWTPTDRHRARVDLPAGSQRFVTLTVWASPFDTIVASYQVGARELASRSVQRHDDDWELGVVVLSDGPELAQALGGMGVVDSRSADEEATIGVSDLPYDATTGDPILPTAPMGWTGVDLLVARAHLLERISEEQRRSLEGWILGGGRMLVLPRSEADLERPFLRSMIGELEIVRREGALPPSALTLTETRGVAFALDEAWIPEVFGGTRQHGLGEIHVASFDAAAPPQRDAEETRNLVHALTTLSETSRCGVDGSLIAPEIALERDCPCPTGAIFPPGSFADDFEHSYSGATRRLNDLRKALDPNASFDGSLAIVALLFFAYVLAVGPLNFRFVSKRNRPTAALVSTPLISFACMLALVGVGFYSKGARSMYRTAEVVDLFDGQSAGTRVRYTSLFSARPLRYDLEASEGSILRVLPAPQLPHLRGYAHADEGVRAEGISSSLWDTVITREEGVEQIDGVIRFEQRDGRVIAVENASDETLRGVVVVSNDGVHALEDISPGARREVPHETELLVVALDHLAGEDPMHAELVRGVHGGVDGGLFAVAAPMLVARVSPPPAANIAGHFERDAYLRLVRVTGRPQARREIFK